MEVKPLFSKSDYESFNITAGFGNVMEVGETILNETVTSVIQGTDISGEVTSDVVIDGHSVIIRVIGGIPYKTYTIRCEIETSNDNFWDFEITMKVR